MVREDKKEIQKISAEIINQTSIILKTALIHESTNIALRKAIEKLISLLNPLIETEKGVTFELIGEFFYVNNIRVRYALEYLLNFDFLTKEFRKRGLGSVIFNNPINPEDIQMFIKAFITSGLSEDPYDKMLEMMDNSQNIKIDRLKKIIEDRLKKVGESDDIDTRRIIKKTYFNAVSFTKGVMKKIRSGERADMKKAKRIVESMVDQLLEDEHLLLSLTALKDYDEYTYHHMVNVSVLSMALGLRLGLNRMALTELGLAALFHDIGKIQIPNEVLNKPTSFTDDEWKMIKKHPIWGVKAILGFGRFGSATIRSVIVSFEHHMNCDLSGYPQVKKYSGLDLYSRIIALADQYDAMTSSRVYSRTPIPPDKTLSIMMEQAGTKLDSLLYKFFINMVGIFPVGTIVMLNTREIGLVYEGNMAFADRPKVLIVIDEKGKSVRGPIVNLSEKNENGKYIRSIMKTLDPEKYKINLAEYFL
ncbi:MAG: HD-GYP domain-containing protein [Nitrospirae bacterium]|nr:HD-GYP domain-containing protein [Nitrospirota bacterium]